MFGISESERRLTDDPSATRTAHPQTTAVRDTVVAAIRDTILRGEYPQGERIPSERKIALQMGVSRGSVREALKRLDQLGLVDIQHGGGARVRPLEDASLDVVVHLLAVDGSPGVELVSQLLEVNELMMAGAVASAVRHASERELARAIELLEELANESLAEDVYLASLDELVQLISAASRNLVLRLVRNSLRSVFTELRGKHSIRSARPPLAIVAPVARTIARALSERDAEQAREGVRLLLRAHSEQLLKRMELRVARSTTGDEPSGGSRNP